MQIVPAAKVKNNFGEMLEIALREMVCVTKSGRKVAVIMSYREYIKLSELLRKVHIEYTAYNGL